MKIKFLKECEAPSEQLLHPDEGCSCSQKVTFRFWPGEELDDYQLLKIDISKLKYNEDYAITEYP